MSEDIDLKPIYGYQQLQIDYDNLPEIVMYRDPLPWYKEWWYDHREIVLDCFMAFLYGVSMALLWSEI